MNIYEIDVERLSKEIKKIRELIRKRAVVRGSIHGKTLEVDT